MKELWMAPVELWSNNIVTEGISDLNLLCLIPDSALQQRFENTRFAHQAKKDIDSSASSVLDCFKSNIHILTTLIQITTFPYHKP